MTQCITLAEYYDMLERHDWYHTMSDSAMVETKGRENQKKLIEIAKVNLEFRNMFDQFYAHHWSGKPWGTVQVPKPERPIECA